jgi:DNA modification methylase
LELTLVNSLFFDNKISELHHGNALDVLKHIPDEVVQTVVTSPPYFGLRDYGNTDQIGLELTSKAYVEKLVEIFREIRRCLKDSGTVWINLGDSYSSGNRKTTTVPTLRVKNNSVPDYNKNFIVRPPIDKQIKPKDLIGIPWKVAFALQKDGWYLRSDIIWNKPNPMPESVQDRPTKSHEYIFLLSKNEKYFYDNKAIREPSSDLKQTAQRYKHLFFTGDKHKSGRGWLGKGENKTKYLDFDGTKNKPSVWTVTLKPIKETHFATYPEDLIIPCILAGTAPNDIVLDPFVGSGTTCVVSQKLNRKSIGIDLNKDYLEIAKNRITKTNLPMF